MPATRNIAAIDVGTNSVHMVVAKVGAKGFDVITTEKEVVRLGEGAGGMDHLVFGAIERGVNAMRHMKRIADAHGASVRAVATSAVREADNRREFIEAVEDATGVHVEVISGNEEARLIHLGVARSLNLGDDTVLTVDIGGGSTEFCVSVKGKIKFAQSVKMGAVRMTDAFLPGGVVTDSGLKKLRARIRSVFAPVAHDLRLTGFDRVILSSGTCETVARIAAARRGKDVPVTFNGFSFDAQELGAVAKTLAEARTPADRLAVAGMESKRADIIVAGCVILQETVRALGASSMEFSEYALREGVLVDTAQRLGLMAADPVDSGEESAERLAKRCSVDLDHAHHVAHLASRILVAVTRHYDVDLSVARLLKTAALLATTGNAVAHARYHQHSYYIIRNADLMGFTDEEIEIIALAARYHRKSMPKESHGEFARLPPDRQHDVELMAAILRIASGLDRSRDRGITQVSSSLKDGGLVLTVRHVDSTDELVELNINTARANAQMLSKYLGDDVTVRNGGAAR